MDRWIALDLLYTLSLTSFLALYKWKFSNTQPHLVVKDKIPEPVVEFEVIMVFSVRNEMREHEAMYKHEIHCVQKRCFWVKVQNLISNLRFS